MMNFLTSTLYLLGRFLASVIYNFFFQKFDFRFCLAICILLELIEKQIVSCWSNTAWLKIRKNLSCVTNHCMNVSRFYNTGKIDANQLKLVRKWLARLLTLLKIIEIMLFHERNCVKLVWWIKEMRIGFLIDNSIAQGNNFKINIKLKVEEICRDCRLDFLWNNWNCIKFYLAVTYLRWSALSNN